jgi:hypothetical protein
MEMAARIAVGGRLRLKPGGVKLVKALSVLLGTAPHGWF